MPSASGRTIAHAPTSPLPSSIPSKNELLGVSRTMMCLRAISEVLRCSSVEIPVARLTEETLWGECTAAMDAKAEFRRKFLRLVLIRAGPFCRCSTTIGTHIHLRAYLRLNVIIWLTLKHHRDQ